MSKTDKSILGSSVVITCLSEEEPRSTSPPACTGTLLECKRHPEDGSLICFIRLKDIERRLGRWFPASTVRIEETGDPITEVVRSGISHEEADEGMRRMNVTEYLELRLSRDMRCPNSVHEIYYLNFAFPPWYYSPFEFLYPEFSEDSDTVPNLYLCPFSLTPFIDRDRMTRHVQHHYLCQQPHPPGREVYVDLQAGLSMYEVDGAKYPAYCRNLFLLSKCFLENKLIGHDVEIYMFYVVCVHQRDYPAFCDNPQARYFAAYYSYEKDLTNNNLACIVSLPCFRGRGLGNFLITASYQIGYRRNIIGTPERPLSDLGKSAYLKFWASCLWKWAGDLLTKHQRTQAVDLTLEQSPMKVENTFAITCTLKEIARAVKLEVNDVLEAVIWLGWMHKGEQLELMLPLPTVNSMRKEASEGDPSRAGFNSQLLRDVVTG